MIESVALILATLLQPPDKSNPNDERTKLRADVAVCMREVKNKYSGFDAYVGRDDTVHWYSSDTGDVMFRKCMKRRGNPLE